MTKKVFQDDKKETIINVILNEVKNLLMKEYFVYILTNFMNSVIYIGITNNLIRRMYEHKNGIIEGFTKKYHLTKLVFYESFSNVIDAIAAEKKIKGWLRIKKIKLIESNNLDWKDLTENL